MSGAEKPIVVSAHAAERMRQRGATTTEVEYVVRNAAWRPALSGKLQAKHQFPFGGPAPGTGRVYKFKKVETIFAEESARIVVVTVKVYYHD